MKTADQVPNHRQRKQYVGQPQSLTEAEAPRNNARAAGSPSTEPFQPKPDFAPGTGEAIDRWMDHCRRNAQRNVPMLLGAARESAQKLSESDPTGERGPIDVGVGLHFAEIEQIKLLGYLAAFVAEQKKALLKQILLKIPDPLARSEFALAITIAQAVDTFKFHHRKDDGPALTVPMPSLFTMPGIMALWLPTLEDALIMIAGALNTHENAIGALAADLQPIDAVNLAYALRISECVCVRNNVADEMCDTFAAQLLIRQLARWSDQWALINIHPEIKRKELDALMAKLPGNGLAKPLQSRSRNPARLAK